MPDFPSDSTEPLYPLWPWGVMGRVIESAPLVVRTGQPTDATAICVMMSPR